MKLQYRPLLSIGTIFMPSLIQSRSKVPYYFYWYHKSGLNIPKHSQIYIKMYQSKRTFNCFTFKLTHLTRVQSLLFFPMERLLLLRTVHFHPYPENKHDLPTCNCVCTIRKWRMDRKHRILKRFWQKINLISNLKYVIFLTWSWIAYGIYFFFAVIQQCSAIWFQPRWPGLSRRHLMTFASTRSLKKLRLVSVI